MWGTGDRRCSDARRLWVLISNLPRDSALVQALSPAQGAWTQTDELLATTVEVLSAKLDVVASFVHGLAGMWSEKSLSAYEPEPVEIPRPEAIETLRQNAPRKIRQQSSMAEVARFLRQAGSNVA
jgi:hypothetical protein